jgi:DeoR/GlpR family transcriptional regulator of sugar metabolism
MVSPSGLKIDYRRKKILELLSRKGRVRVADLSAELGATPVTIRNDLAALGEEGLLDRVSGGAVQRVNNYYNVELHLRRQDNDDIKKRIAAAAAALISDGETLFINSGTTTYFTAIELKKLKNLNIVTNSIPIAMELGTVSGFTVMLLGGEINTQYSFTCGINTLEQLRRFKADKTLLSMDGIDANCGLTTYHAEEAIINRTMIERSRETIITADHTKIGYESFSFVDDLHAGLTLVTDEKDPEAASLDEIEKAMVQVIIAGMPEK